MQMRLFLIAVVFIGPSASTAFADASVGRPAPAVAAEQWFNLPEGVEELRPEHLKGQIVAVEFWATWCGPCIRGIPHLSEMQEKYRDQGVIVIGLSYEPAATVKNAIKAHRIPYIIGAGAEQARDLYGIRAYPTMFLIDPDGKVAWKGHPMEAEPALKKLLKDRPPTQSGVLAKAAAERALADAQAELDAKRYSAALDAYRFIAEKFKGAEAAKTAASMIELMQTNEEIMAAIRLEAANKKGRRLIEFARTLARNGAVKDAARFYRRIIEECAGTEYEAAAREELARF